MSCTVFTVAASFLPWFCQYFFLSLEHIWAFYYAANLSIRLPSFAVLSRIIVQQSLETNKTKKFDQLSLTNRATHLYKCTGVTDLLKSSPSHMCYHAEFVRPSALKVRVGINTGEPSKLGSAETPLSWDGNGRHR